MRLIDADALTEFIDDGHLNNPNEKLYSENDIREMIDMMPTVDAEPVIRCKDCVHAFPADTPHTCTRSEMRIKAYGFCAWATKRRNTDDK